MITDNDLDRYTRRYGVEAMRCNNGEAVSLLGDAFSPCLLELGLADRKTYEFVKETLIRKHCAPEIVSLLDNLKKALPR